MKRKGLFIVFMILAIVANTLALVLVANARILNKVALLAATDAKTAVSALALGIILALVCLVLGATSTREAR